MTGSIEDGIIYKSKIDLTHRMLMLYGPTIALFLSIVGTVLLNMYTEANTIPLIGFTTVMFVVFRFYFSRFKYVITSKSILISLGGCVTLHEISFRNISEFNDSRRASYVNGLSDDSICIKIKSGKEIRISPETPARFIQNVIDSHPSILNRTKYKSD